MGVFALLFAALSYLGWALVVKPVNVKIEERSKDLEDAKKKLSEAQIKAAQHDKFQALAENVRRDLVFISSRVDPVLGKSELYRIFSLMGNHLALPNYTFIPKERTGSKDAGIQTMEEIPVEVTFVGGYHDVGQFLSWAISQDRMVIPDRLNLTQMTPQGDGLPSISADIFMRVVLEQAAPK
jgi:Tfp pilus assembly protein PilO